MPGLHGIQRENGSWRIGRHDHPPPGRHRRARPRLGARPATDRRPAGAQPRHDRRLAGARRPASDLPAVLLALRGRGDGARARAAADDRGRRAVPGLPHHLAGPRRGDHRGAGCPAIDGWGFGYEKFNRRAEDWAMVGVCALVKKAADGSCEDVRIGLTHMGSTPLRATAAEEALRGRRPRRRRDRPRGRAGGRGHRAARATSTPRPTTSATWRGCSRGGRWRRPPEA